MPLDLFQRDVVNLAAVRQRRRSSVLERALETIEQIRAGDWRSALPDDADHAAGVLLGAREERVRLTAAMTRAGLSRETIAAILGDMRS
jgi:hypothetical protein